ncbi:unnamed protein product, partial [Gulo gulo]
RADPSPLILADTSCLVSCTHFAASGYLEFDSLWFS